MRHNPSSRRSWLPPAQRTEEPHGFSTLPSCHLFLHPIALPWATLDYLAQIFEGYVAKPVRLANAVSHRSTFPSDNHAVQFGAVSPELPDISRVTAHG